MSDINEEQKRLYKRAEENDIKLLKEENEKYKEVLDKIKEIIKKDFDMEINDDFALESIYKLLEEIE